MKSLKNTKTMENLMKAFAGESQARTRYNFYASVANKEGYRQIEAIFNETADNEKEHAKRFYKFLLEGLNGELPASIMINADYPVAYGNTLDNLKAAAAGENEEWTKLYPEFAKVAKEEGFDEIAAAFTKIAEVEQRHEARYKKLAENIENNKVFNKDEKVLWKCRNCGYVHEGNSAPEKCPACAHPKAFFEVLAENY
ncbi:MAG TPA: rubrerythrin family protein [Hungateiclostridium thermocellum]|uniref:Rubrerythrin n=1 Tax=Acetivibrio thermocellus (strain ATCC 27405 / DSM 1237 / JCM 9322 / NBRC 103400 / NCIMB 10682 / NRRL B-4536 / VPI 7372) TaxID=203119 RepID=A3DDR5_ACET2|nr:rubrerythrin family protein [Acetivibrio thermocellus]CDG35552.1 Rubrerythrin-1 [Acetivibrio thermocellus BC1]ABN52094.1 Rubrerythrin [Acetivibrio thermocellus ATCC 27405]NLU25663.1 rubrerythrin family protein [Acetivibrio thermocellus]THJ77278.1 rubrerythrin family protein [Acetivibrio thermocellus]UWV48307.1 rubrerythrin family protein [Acetivibrio thermocellus]